MFDYKKFKKDMNEKGHIVHKKELYITVEPDNNYYDVGKASLMRGVLFQKNFGEVEI